MDFFVCAVWAENFKIRAVIPEIRAQTRTMVDVKLYPFPHTDDRSDVVGFANAGGRCPTRVAETVGC